MSAFANFARAANATFNSVQQTQARRAEEERQKQLNDIIAGVGNFGAVSPLLDSGVGATAAEQIGQDLVEPGVFQQTVAQPEQQQRPELEDPVQIINQVQREVADNQLKLSEFVQRGGDIRRAQFLSNRLDTLSKNALRERFGGNVTQVLSSLRNRIATDKGDDAGARSLARVAIDRNPELGRFIDPDDEDFATVVAERSAALGLDTDIAKGELDVSLKDQVDDNALANDLTLQRQKSADSEAQERLRQEGTDRTAASNERVASAGQRQDLTTGTTSTVQKSLAAKEAQLRKLDSIAEDLDDGEGGIDTSVFLQQNKARASVGRFLDQFGLEEGVLGTREELEKQAQVKPKIKEFFNAYRKEITGAAAAVAELKDLEEATLSFNITPKEFEIRFKNIQSAARREIQAVRDQLREGIDVTPVRGESAVITEFRRDESGNLVPVQ